MNIKELAVVKEIRRRKWMRLSKAFMFDAGTVSKLEETPEKIKQALKQQCERWPQQTTDFLNKFEICFDRSNQDHEKVKTDALFCYFAYGFSANEYFCYQLGKKSVVDRKAFLSERDSVYIGYRYNDMMDMEYFNDKTTTYQMLKSYYKRDLISVKRDDDREKFDSFVAQHPVFVKKTNYQACGRGVEKIDVAAYQSTDELFDALRREGDVILEELIQQDQSMALFNQSSVNTVRVITINTSRGIYCPFTFFKVGRKNAFVDNGGAGGILVGIDAETGVMNTAGVDERNNRYETHPDSGVEFQGYCLKDWDTMLEQCREMSKLFPRVRVIGWDLAYTSKGWVVVEGNAMTEVIGPQATTCCGIRDEMMKLLEAE